MPAAEGTNCGTDKVINTQVTRLVRYMMLVFLFCYSGADGEFVSLCIHQDRNLSMVDGLNTAHGPSVAVHVEEVFRIKSVLVVDPNHVLAGDTAKGMNASTEYATPRYWSSFTSRQIYRKGFFGL